MECSTDRQVVIPFFLLRKCNLETIVHLWTVRHDPVRAFIFRLPATTHHSSIYLLSFINMHTAVLQLEDAHAIWLNSFIDIPNHRILYSQRIVIAQLNSVKSDYFYYGNQYLVFYEQQICMTAKPQNIGNMKVHNNTE